MALQLENFLITGRTFTEYCAFFNLDIHTLRGKKVLDCPSGVSSFIAEAMNKGVDAYGCDPVYHHPLSHITTQATETINKIYEDTSWMEGHNFHFYGSIENHRHFRESALRTFVQHFNQERYAGHALPHLPYPDNNFDLLLSSHLLFVYDDRLNLQFHTEAITEMLRIAKEVRIFPLIDFTNSRKNEANNLSPYAYEIEKRFHAQRCRVNFEFQRGGGVMLKITKQ